MASHLEREAVELAALSGRWISRRNCRLLLPSSALLRYQPRSSRCELNCRINRFFREVGQHQILRIYRSATGDWCAEITVADRVWIEAFDYHPTVALMRALKANGTDIDDDIVDQGAEGENVRSLA